MGEEWDTTNHYDRWTISDAAGYSTWLAAPFSASETHGQALSRINDQINTLNDQTIPALRQTLVAAEIRCRKGLMDQGLFAEDLFDTDTSGNADVFVALLKGHGLAGNEQARRLDFGAQPADGHHAGRIEEFQPV